MEHEKPERIAKRIAASGLCSRRDAEKLILAGKVTLNDTQVETAATLVTSSDIITVNGKPIAKKLASQLWAFHKPAGYIVSEKDPQNRESIFDLLPQNMPRCVTIGRLDYQTEGLLLLTTDGALKRHMELPKTGLKRVYKVEVQGNITNAQLQGLQQGLVTKDRHGESVTFGKIHAKKLDNNWLEIAIFEGKNHEVRLICKYFDLKVLRLIRTHYGDYALGNLPLKQLKELEHESTKP